MSHDHSSPSSSPLPNRRQFLATSSTLLGALTFPTIISAAAAPGSGVNPSEKIGVGVIGCGPQGVGDMSNFLNHDTCRVLAVCDVKTDRLEIARKAVNTKYRNEDCRTFHDFRELLAAPGIDACLIATPDHWHVLTALAAVHAGKDVYLEKPLAVSLAEGQALRTAVHRRNRVFQFGTQQRSGRMFRLACELARNGAIGQVQHINVWAPGSAPGGSRREVPPPPTLDYDFWQGPAPLRAHTEDRCSDDGGRKTWWFISDYSLGFVTGWGIHPMDIAYWGASDRMKGTVSVEGRGNFRLADGVCDTASIWEVDYRFASGLTLNFVGVPNGGNGGAPTGEPWLHGEEWKQRYRRINSHGTAFEGSSGWAHVDRSGINLQPESLIDLRPDDFKIKLTRSADHTGNFLECVRSRAETVCPIDAAVKADTLCHLADIAMRLQRKLTFDMDHERFVGDAEANQRLKCRPLRAPWKL